MNEVIIHKTSEQLHLNHHQVQAVVSLLQEGATIPFIARYRKEKTDSLDEVAISEIKKLYDKFTELIKRKEVILESIREQGQLSLELEKKINESWNSTEIEDMYLPYRPKKKTKASVAKEKGLEPLARIIMAQQERNILQRARQFINENVADEEEAFGGARDIIAEWISEHSHARKQLRWMFQKEAVLFSTLVKGKAIEGSTYRDYFNYSSKLDKLPSHRFLAMARGQRENFLRLSIEVDVERACQLLESIFVKSSNECAQLLIKAIKDSYKRLIQPGLETEFMNRQKELADEEAIRIFSINLRQLLLESPLGQKRVMGVDPGFRTGCKIVCLDELGQLLQHATIFPHPPQNEPQKSEEWVKRMVESNGIEAIAIGKGTAGRETEAFFRKIHFNHPVKIFLISEDGASIYSASEVAREEFGEYDLTVRGAVSIGRRLMDPLAELVKIDPKSLGVGQYQHDVDQKNLRESLVQVVESCVNHVGVHVNTASKQLLSYVSGVGPQLAQNIVDYRNSKGAFRSRDDLKQVKRMGEKAFEQCAGFLRISDARNPLDNSSVHPESYYIVQKMAADLKCSLRELIDRKELRSGINPKEYVTDKTGLPTITDILAELEKPGRDPRAEISSFEYSIEMGTFEDLSVGMVMDGIVTNITNFGAFVDIGVKEQGLVHISEISDRFIKNPADVLKLKQKVRVKIINLDVDRKRIQLSMKSLN